MDVEVLIQYGRQALACGKFKEANAFLGVATARFPEDPRPWFTFAGLHARQGKHDLAALCFSKAATNAAKAKDSKVSYEIARINAALSASQVLPRDWLSYITCPLASTSWDQASSYHLSQAFKSGGTVVFIDGIGYQAVQAARLLQQLRHAQPTPATVTSHQDSIQPSDGKRAAAAVQIITCHANDLTSALATLLIKDNNVEDCVTVAPSFEDWIQKLLDGGEAADDIHIHGNSAPMLVAMPQLCTANLQLVEMLRTLHQMSQLPGPSPRLCPCRIVLRGQLVCSQELLHMNMVNLDDMQHDTGLDYGPCNEFLWRHSRSMQVDRLDYTAISAPFTVKSWDLAQILNHIKHGEANTLGAELVSSSPRVTCTCTGTLDCVVTWTDIELSPGVWISNAPQHALPAAGVAPGADEAGAATDVHHFGTRVPVLQQHIWQRVHFLPFRPQVSCGQTVTIDCSITDGETVRIELDEDSLLQEHQPLNHVTAAEMMASVEHHNPDNPDNPLAACLPAGESLSSVSSDSASEQDDQTETSHQSVDHATNSLSGHQSGFSIQAISSEVSKQNAAGEGHGRGPIPVTILPYHMCMLNDRDRTLRYKAGIQGAVRAMLERHATNSSSSCRNGVVSTSNMAAPPPWVLDVGMGTGLLSFLASQAGAPAVVGIERETALAMVSMMLIEANGRSHVCKVLNAQTAAVSVAVSADDVVDPDSSNFCHTEDDDQSRNIESQRWTEEPDAGNTPQPKPWMTRDKTVHDLVMAGVKEGAWKLLSRPSLVVHEIFGSDPLSEHILTTMRHVKGVLAGPDTVFMPGRFRVVAVLARSEALRAAVYGDTRYNITKYIRPPRGCDSNAGFSTSTTEALQPSVDVVNMWANHRYDCDVKDVPDMVFLTQPTPVLDFDLNTGTEPLPLSGGGNVVALPACAPTTVQQYINVGRCRLEPDGAGAAAKVVSESEPEVAVVPNCAVFWFEADMGEGGWLSTGPGYTKYGHWSQCIDFDAVPDTVTQSISHQYKRQQQQQQQSNSNDAASDIGACTHAGEEHVGTRIREYSLRASYTVDRVHLKVTGWA